MIDTGIGIPQDRWNAALDPFVQADNSVTRKFGGTGLGLAITRRIKSRAAGRDPHARQQSRRRKRLYGHGSTWATRRRPAWPMKRGPISSRRRPRDPQPLPPVAARGRVLVVEDGDTNSQADRPHSSPGGAGSRHGRKRQIGCFDAAIAQPFDAILMDNMQMPVMDGHSTATQTLRRCRGMQLPIIALTAYWPGRRRAEVSCRRLLRLHDEADPCGFARVAEHRVPVHHPMAIREWRYRASGRLRHEAPRENAAVAIKTLVGGVTAAIRLCAAAQPAAPPGRHPLEPAHRGPGLPRNRRRVRRPAAHANGGHSAGSGPRRPGRIGPPGPLAQQALAAAPVSPRLTPAPAKRLETVVRAKRCDEIALAIDELVEVAARLVKPSSQAPPAVCR